MTKVYDEDKEQLATDCHAIVLKIHEKKTILSPIEAQLANRISESVLVFIDVLKEGTIHDIGD